MPPRTRPALVPRAHETSIFLYWRATSLLIPAPLLRAWLLSSGMRSRTSPLALRRRDGRSFDRLLRKGFMVILDDWASSIGSCTPRREVGFGSRRPADGMPSAGRRRDKDAAGVARAAAARTT